MSQKIASYIRQHHLSLVAIFIALTGTAYAAGNIGAADIKNDAVRSRHLLDGTVRSRDVRNEGLTGADVRDDTLATLDVRDAGLTGADLANDSIAGRQVLDSSLGGEDVAFGSLLSEDIANNDLVGADVQNESLTGLDIFNGSLDQADLGASSVGSGELANGSVTTDKYANIPTVRARRTTSQSIGSGTFTAVALNVETWDVGAMHSTFSNTARLFAPFNGVYLITANVLWQPNDTGIRALGVRRNGAGFIAAEDDSAADTSDDFLALSTVYRLSANDFVEMMVQQTSGGALNVDASSGGAETSPEFSMTWLGPAG